MRGGPMAIQFEHSLVPKMSVASEKEVKELFDGFKIDSSKLPVIYEDDPSLPEGAKVGDIIKILRRSLVTDKEEKYYRVVRAVE